MDPLVGWVVQKKFSNKSCSPYMILVSIIFSGVGYHYTRAPRMLPTSLAVAHTGTGLAQPRGSERVKIPHHMDFYTKIHLSHSVKFWNQSLGVILNHSSVLIYSRLWLKHFKILADSLWSVHSKDLSWRKFQYISNRCFLTLSPVLTKVPFQMYLVKFRSKGAKL